tara:strand:+ start:1010 stop:1168 length:159 start_codon:yes stop_codon:yes gene_type:complete
MYNIDIKEIEKDKAFIDLLINNPKFANEYDKATKEQKEQLFIFIRDNNKYIK